MELADEWKLNRYLLKWAGFVEGDIKKHYYHEVGGERLPKWREPGREWHIKPPNFPRSMDACFEWLVPKIDKWNITKPFKTSKYVVANVWLGTKYTSAEAGNPALALCLAVEKLVGVAERD